MTQPDQVDQQPGQPFPTRVLLEAHGIDVRIEGTEPAAELAQLALDAFTRIHQFRPSIQPTGFTAGSSVQAERAEPLAHPLDSPTHSPHIH